MTPETADKAAAALERAREIGQDHGANAAAWWEQDTIGGRVSAEKSVEAAAIVLRGLDDGDPAVWDALPMPDLSGQWADGYSSDDLITDCGADQLPDIYGELYGELCDAYQRAFSETAQDAIYSACRVLLEERGRGR
jgi:hypothetical protein